MGLFYCPERWVVPLFNPSQDLTAIQLILTSDAILLSLLDLTGATDVDIAKHIIKRSQWNDLASNEKRLCIYFVPDRPTSNVSFYKGYIQIDCHIPSILDYKAYEIQERVFSLLHEKKINKRNIYFNGQLGELPTMPGFFCCGSRYTFNRKI